MVLQLLLSSPKRILRFGAVRALNLIALQDAGAVAVCNVELENLVSDSNHAISTLAITTLLSSGSENAVDRLMQQVMALFSGLQVRRFICLRNTSEFLFRMSISLRS